VLIVTVVVKGGILWVYDLTFIVTHTKKFNLPTVFLNYYWFFLFIST